jgi:hypothetical protein
MLKLTLPPRLRPKDKVAIVSPSAGCANLFPWVYELGLQRLRDEFDLIPVEFPTAKQSPDYLSTTLRTLCNRTLLPLLLIQILPIMRQSDAMKKLVLNL